MKHLLHIALILAATDLFGQSVSHQVINLFDDRERGIWVLQYEGRMDDLSYVYLVLGYNESEYKGIMQQKGLEDWFVEGDITGDSLRLLVTNDDDEVKGYLEGTIQDSMVTADFSGPKRSFQRDMQLKRVLRHTSVEDCGSDMWLKTFDGALMEDQVQLVLQKEEEDILVGLLYFEDQNVSYDLFGECLNDTCSEIDLDITNPQNVALGKVKYDVDESGEIWLEMANHISTPLKQTQDLPMLCGSRFFRESRMSYVIPFFENKRADTWLRSQLNDWLSLFDENADIEKPDHRFWIDLDFVGPRLISGTINYHHPDYSLTQRESFILPLDEEAPVEVWQWLSDPESFRAFLNDAVASEKERRSRNEPPSAATWLTEQDFRYISVRREGLCLKTELSPIYGDRKIIVPWSLVEPHTRRFVNIKKYVR